MQTRLLDRRWPWLVAAGAILLVFASTFVEIRPPGWDPRPSGSAEDIAALRERDDLNVLFVVIDTLRADRLGSYGYERDTSPALDRLAAGGVRFAHTLAQSSWTKSSMASLWTGLYPTRTGITRFDQVVPETAEFPAEILQRAGFTTAGIYRNGWVAPTFGFGQGFEIYRRPATRPISPNLKRENPTLTDRGTDEDLIEAALEFLRIYGHERWFLYLHPMDVHEYLYDEESALFGTSHSDIYDNSIRHTDGVLQVLLDSLADTGQLQKTLVVITSDHGEAFGERGYDGHAREVFRESTEVPFLLGLPFRLEPGVVVTPRTRNVDVWPTVLDLLGLALPGPTDGRSLVPEILAEARGEQRALAPEAALAHLDQTWARPELAPRITVAVADDAFRYVRLGRPGGEVEQLFDRRDDPEEMRDRRDAEPATLARMRALADAYLETEPVWGEAPTRELGELESNQLRALGYAVP